MTLKPGKAMDWKGREVCCEGCVHRELRREEGCRQKHVCVQDRSPLRIEEFFKQNPALANEYLEHPYFEVRATAAKFADLFRLTALLDDEDESVRWNAALRLPHRFLLRLREDPKREVRIRVASYLEEEELTPMMSDPDYYVRQLVARRIGVPQLKYMIDDPDPEVRQVVVQRISPEWLVELVSDPDASVCLAVAQRLEPVQLIPLRFHGDIRVRHEVAGRIDAARKTGLKRVNLSIPLSDIQMRAKLREGREEILARIGDVISYAVDSGLRVAMGGEDSSRADMDFLLMAVETAAAAGAHRFRYADTLGSMEPFSVFGAFVRLRKEIGLELEFHGHDDLGLATANTLAAIRGGAAHASVCVLGLGERAGNAALEEVAAGLSRFLGNCSNVNLAQLPRLAELVAKAAGRPIPVGKSIVGANAFTHESGIHVDGLLKDPSTYEAVSPQTFGLARKIVLGKHSGMASVAGVLQSLGLFTDTSRTKNVLAQVRERSMEAKRVIQDDELLDFYRRASDKERPTSAPIDMSMEMRYDCA